MTEQNTQGLSPFELALQKRQQAEQEQESARNNAGNWYHTEKKEHEAAGLINEKEIVGRIIGNPIEVRNKPTDPKLILQSEVVKDDKKGYFKLNWPYVEKNGYINPDPNWIVTRFMKKVFDGKWVKYTESDIDGKRIIKKEGKIINTETKSKFNEGEFKYYNTHTEIFKLLKYGNSKIDELYPKDFEPSKRVVCNWLDRMDDWCQINKHYKLLAAARNPYERKKDGNVTDTIYFTSTGIPKSLYDMIINHCKAVGTLDIDLILIKNNKLQAKYEVWDITDAKYISEDSLKIGKKEPLTEEEKSYEAYDLDKFYKISSYFKIKKVLGSRMALCDAELGTHFVVELDELVKQEKEEYEKSKQELETNDVKTEVKSEDSPPVIEKPTSIVKEEPKVEIPRRESQNNTPVNTIENQCLQIFKFWGNLSDVEKQVMISSIEYFDGNVPIYKESGHPGCSNKGCYYEGTKQITLVPNGVNSCPVCGITF